jgi:hypothetical protein
MMVKVPWMRNWVQHAKNLIWVSVKPLLLLSEVISITADDESLPSPVLPSVAKVFGILGIIRDYIVPYIMRKDVITRDPSIPKDVEGEPDEVKLRIEAGLAAAANSSISSSSSNKRDRE